MPGPTGMPGFPPIPPPFIPMQGGPGPTLLQLPPIFNDMMTMLRDNRHMQVASLEQQRELMRYMTSLNDWLGRDVDDRQAELRGVLAHVDALRNELYRLAPGMQQQQVPGPQGAPGQPGGFMAPPGVFRPTTAPPGTMPTATMPPGTGQYPGGPTIVHPPQMGPQMGMGPMGPMGPVYPGVIPQTPSTSASPVIPSPPSRQSFADRPHIPDVGRYGDGPPPQQAPGIYQPPVPQGEPEVFIPPSITRSSSSSSRSRSPASQRPIVVPPPAGTPIIIHPQQPGMPGPSGPLVVHSARPESSYSGRSSPHSPAPVPVPAGPTIVNVPPATSAPTPTEPRDGYTRHPSSRTSSPIRVEQVPAAPPPVGSQQPIIIHPPPTQMGMPMPEGTVTESLKGQDPTRLITPGGVGILDLLVGIIIVDTGVIVDPLKREDIVAVVAPLVLHGIEVVAASHEVLDDAHEVLDEIHGVLEEAHVVLPAAVTAVLVLVTEPRVQCLPEPVRAQTRTHRTGSPVSYRPAHTPDIPQVVHTRPATHRTGSPYRGPPSETYEHEEPTPSEYERHLREAAAHPERPYIPTAPSGVSRTRPSEGARTAVPTEYGEEPRDEAREEPPIAFHVPPESPTEESYEPRSPSARQVPAPQSPRAQHPSGPGDLSYEDAERARQERFGEVEQQLVQTARAAEEAEDKREHEFRMNEEDRERIFAENEQRREREAMERRDAILQQIESNIPAPLPIPPPEGPQGPPSERPESVIEPIRDAAVRHADEIKSIVSAEREELAREREAAEAERMHVQAEAEEARRLLDEERVARIKELEEELARVRGELDGERQQREAEEAERREQERAEDLERDEAVRNQLGDITNLVQQQRDEFARKKELMEERWQEKQERQEEKDRKCQDMYDLVASIHNEQLACKAKCEEDRAEAASKPGIEEVLNELREENRKLRELFTQFSDNIMADCKDRHDELLNTVRATAQERVPFNVQGYLDEFSKSLASEVRTLLTEVGKLREERRALQFELGTLMSLRSKYGPGGEFEPDWRPPGDTGAFGAGHPGGGPGDAPPPPPPADFGPPPEMPRPAWRSVHPRTSRRGRKKSEGLPVAATHPPPVQQQQPTTMAADPQQRAGSWATWLPDPNIEYTPPPTEPTTRLAPPAPPPGLFGPRSPRDSVRNG
ncbi:hypothetical protein EWM64_g3507 [Hericium alpestre]|uniref:Uncharacterized protein n=1 Tax=Hericium alpestre TaxID=135208 RepID=A0A4Z0A055_9AGAM|nr:hypothetical protein EWM64_g3507 [Hericium alpestre]